MINFFKIVFSFLLLRKPAIIIVTPNNIRLGNHLYYLLHCNIENKRSTLFKYVILEDDNLVEWLIKFPELRKLVKNKEKVKRLDIKKKDYSFFQRFGKDFTEEELNDFIDVYIKPEIIKFESSEFSSDDLIINLRIGDYYASVHESKYGFNQTEYVKFIFNHSENFSLKKYTKIIIISDDQNWCKKHLNFLDKYCEELIISDEYNDAFKCLIGISLSKNLIISNSTFSYWRAYISNRINNCYNVIAPAFHSRAVQDEISYQLNPKWKIVSKEEFNFDQLVCKDLKMP